MTGSPAPTPLSAPRRLDGPLLLMICLSAILALAIAGGASRGPLLGLLLLQTACLGAAQLRAGMPVRARLRSAEAALAFHREAARTDPVTGLLNRRGLEAAFARARSGDLGLLYLDLDGFKRVNDRLGHAAGDALLQEVGRRLEEVCAHRDAVAARVGGDEFLVLAPHARAEDLQAFGDELVTLMGLPYGLEGRLVTDVGLSAGAAAARAADDLASLAARADAALLQAKARGKRRCVLAEERRPHPVAA